VLSNLKTGKSRAERTRNDASDKVRRLGAAIEERDATIGRLEQTIAEQTVQIETLQQELDQANFQTGILEQSYSTQLSEARERAAAAEQSVDDQQTRIAELETDQRALDSELAGVRARLDTLGGSDAATIDELLAGCSSPEDQAPLIDPDDTVDEPVDPQSLEEMLAPDVMFAGKSK
jgi:chromosome segregation ATPase